MPSENEELDVTKDTRWKNFINMLRGRTMLRDPDVVREFDFRLVRTLQRVFRLLKVPELITACLNDDQMAVTELLREHHRQRDRAAPYAQLIRYVCLPGMTYPDAISEFVHGVCDRILDQAAVKAFPSDNFPTVDEFGDARARWVRDMEPRLEQIARQLARDPTKLRAARRPDTPPTMSLVK